MSELFNSILNEPLKYAYLFQLLHPDDCERVYALLVRALCDRFDGNMRPSNAATHEAVLSPKLACQTLAERRRFLFHFLVAAAARLGHFVCARHSLPPHGLQASNRNRK